MERASVTQCGERSGEGLYYVERLECRMWWERGGTQLVKRRRGGGGLVREKRDVCKNEPLIDPFIHWLVVWASMGRIAQ